MEKEMTCIGCPMGCSLTVKVEGDEILVSGNSCPNGEKYAKNEIRNPLRTITSTVKVINGEIGRVSIKSKDPVLKGKIFDCMEKIRKLEVEAPVRAGEILIKNVADTGIDIIATKSVNKQ